MARIPEAEIERLKSEVCVERLIESSGVALRKSGKDWLGQCPFHDDGEPSLVVTPSKNLRHCFGCQTGGGPIDWVMKHRGVSFRHAVELLKEGVSSLAADPVKRTSVRALPAPVAFDADDQRLLNQVIDYYHQTLKQSPEALAYLKSRGLDHPELIERFKLGYANRTLGLRLPEKNRRQGEAIRNGKRGQARLFSPSSPRFFPSFLRCRGTIRCPARSAARLRLTSYSGHLLDPGVKTRIAQRLTLVQRLTNVINGCAIQLRPKQRPIGGLSAFVASPQRQIQRVRREVRVLLP